MRLLYVIGFLSSCLFTNLVFAQTNKELAAAEKKKQTLLAKAFQELKEENYIEAEKLYFEANRVFPSPGGLTELASKKMSLGDVKGANRVMDTAIARLKTIKEDYYYTLPRLSSLYEAYQSKAYNNFQKGDPVIGLHDVKRYLSDYKGGLLKKEHIVNLISLASDIAFSIEDKESLLAFQQAGMSLKSERISFITSIYIALLNEQYDESINTLIKAAENGEGFLMSKVWAQSLLWTAYLIKGDYANAQLTIDKFASKNILVGEKHLGYEYGQIALSQKRYDDAIKHFSDALEPYKWLGTQHEKIGKFRYYAKRAEAYQAINDNINARKDYEAALVFNPNYKPALNGLALLEGQVVQERRTDKVAPEINIMEPSVSRGLKVTASGNDIMVKGIARDPAGLHSVTINGQAVYSKQEGDFWGAITLKEGLNKLVIIATDLAGNSGEQTFEIEKQAGPIPAVNEIVPVKEQEGRNFAILIASQNYDDSAIPSLDNPIADAVRLKLILKNSYNFLDENLVTLFNPDRSDFKKKFLGLAEVIRPEDNLVIFYAGHGIWVEKEKKGYWLLSDASRNDINTWLPNKEVLDMIAELPARHTLLITDACFSGSVFKTRGLGGDAPPALREIDNKISRVAITSGNDTEVPDESVFMKYLVKALSENKEKYLTAQKMFVTQIIEAVMTETKTEPRYGTLELAGHVGGDYIFTKK